MGGASAAMGRGWALREGFGERGGALGLGVITVSAMGAGFQQGWGLLGAGLYRGRGFKTAVSF